MEYLKHFKIFNSKKNIVYDYIESTLIEVLLCTYLILFAQRTNIYFNK